MNQIDPDEEKALEGMFFSPQDIKLYLDGSLDADRLSQHLNAYILQAFRIGKESK